MDDDLDVQARKIKELPILIAFDWAGTGLRILAQTLDDTGRFNAGATASKLADNLHQLRKDTLDK